MAQPIVAVTGGYSWTAATGATSYYVYSGTTNPPPYWTTTTSPSISWPGAAAYETTYFWQVYAVNLGGTTAGPVWTFTTENWDSPPAAASSPYPANTANNVSVGVDGLYWTPGERAVLHDVYFGTTNPPPFVGNQDESIYTLVGPLANNTTYYWRINEINSQGTTLGPVWSFSTDSYRLPPEGFSILPWSEPWRNWGPADSMETLTDMYKCGFNVGGFLSPANLDLAAKVGIKGIVFDEKINMRWESLLNLTQSEVDQRVSSVVNDVGDHRALYAYYFKDEPSTAFYPLLAKCLDALRRFDPYHVGYINLFPNYASSTQLGTSSYAQYLNDFKSINPYYISYDHYYMKGSTPGSGYWNNMVDVMNAAKSIGKPFWFIAQAVVENHNGTPVFDVPTRGTLSMQAYSAMAYGAKGIAWYQYFQWAEDTEPGVTMTHAAIAPNGTKQNTWYLLRDVNLELHRVGETYVNWTHHNVYHGTTGNYLSGFSGSGSFVVGEFTDNYNRRCVLIANKSMTGGATVNSVSWHGGGSTLWVNPTTGAVSGFGGTTLSAGQGLLLIRN